MSHTAPAPGIYTLPTYVVNAKPDRRRRYSWPCRPTVQAGSRFRVSHDERTHVEEAPYTLVSMVATHLEAMDEGHKCEGVRVQIGFIDSAGKYHPEEDAFVQKVVSALESHAVETFDGLIETCANADPRAVLKALVRAGKVSLADVKELFDRGHDIYDFVGE